MCVPVAMNKIYYYLQVLLAIILGSIGLGQAAPLLANFTAAKSAAAIFFETIDAVS